MERDNKIQWNEKVKHATKRKKVENTYLGCEGARKDGKPAESVPRRALAKSETHLYSLPKKKPQLWLPHGKSSCLGLCNMPYKRHEELES